jgi:hypothetical protein
MVFLIKSTVYVYSVFSMPDFMPFLLKNISNPAFNIF